MTDAVSGGSAQLERALASYRRDCSDLGARLLRLEEEKSAAIRAAQRSRTAARLVREAYRLADARATPGAIGGALLEAIADSVPCDGAALLTETPAGSGRFLATQMTGVAGAMPAAAFYIAAPPAFFFTTAQSRIESPAFELTGILRLPCILWAYDRHSGVALILGNRAENAAGRSFDAGDRELIETALSAYLDVLARTEADEEQIRIRRAAGATIDATAEFLGLIGGALRPPLNAILGESEKMASGSRYPLTIEKCAEFADRIHHSGLGVVALLNGLLDYDAFVRGTRSLSPQWQALSGLLAETIAAVEREAPPERRIAPLVAAPIADPATDLHVDGAAFRQAMGYCLRTMLGSGGAVTVTAAGRADGSLDITATAAAPDAAAVVGLALPMLRAMIELHDGTLATYGDEQAGAVTITLPPHRVRRAARD